MLFQNHCSIGKQSEELVVEQFSNSLTENVCVLCVCVRLCVCVFGVCLYVCVCVWYTCVDNYTVEIMTRSTDVVAYIHDDTP